MKGTHMTVYNAGLVISAERCATDDALYHDRKKIEAMIKEDLEYQVLSMFYENQIKEHAEAIHNFIAVSGPIGYWKESYDEWSKARDKILSLARTMPPREKP